MQIIKRHLPGIECQQVARFVDQSIRQVQGSIGIEEVETHLPFIWISDRLSHPRAGTTSVTVGKNNEFMDHLTQLGRDDCHIKIPDAHMSSGIFLVLMEIRRHIQDRRIGNLVAVHFINDQIKIGVLFFVDGVFDRIKRIGLKHILKAVETGVQAVVIRASDRFRYIDRFQGRGGKRSGNGRRNCSSREWCERSRSRGLWKGDIPYKGARRHENPAEEGNE